MKKKLISILAAAAMMSAAGTTVSADFYSDYIGSYYTANTDGEGYAALDITECTGSNISLRFKRIKNGNELYTYTFSEGIVTGYDASVPFSAVTASGSQITGKMALSFSGSSVRVDVKSDNGVALYNGLMPKSSTSYFNTDTPSAPQATAAPSPNPSQTPAPVQDRITVKLNGETLSFADTAEPRIIRERTFVPLRSVFSMMGINVYWDEYNKNIKLKEQLITCTKNDMIIQFSRTFSESGYSAWTLSKWENGDTTVPSAEKINISENQPTIIGNTSFVPLRLISELFGANVNWDEASRTVIIDGNTDNAYWHDKNTIADIEDFTFENAKSYITTSYASIEDKDKTPYYNGENKFYKFKAMDRFGFVILKIYHGGYIDTEPDTSAADLYQSPEPEQTPSPAPVTEPDEAEDTGAISEALTDDEEATDAESGNESEIADEADSEK